jgi:pimeloyl-ACP methyl ester carboxylesterase
LPKFCSKSATIASVQAADYVDAGGTQLFVRRWGKKGRAGVFYWHGGGGGSTEWPEIAPALEAAGYAVYAPAAPGYGESPPLELEQYRASDIAAVAAALIDALDVAPVVWIGFSWGAAIGVHVAARYPDRLRALVLLDGGYLDPADDPEDDPSLDFAGRMERWRAELDATNDESEAARDVVAAAMAGSNVDPALPLLPEVEAGGLPVLLVAGGAAAEYQGLRNRALVRFRAAVPSAEVVTVGAGHGVLDEAGDDVRRIVLDWLERVA